MVLADGLMAPWNRKRQKSPEIGMTQKCFPEPSVGQTRGGNAALRSGTAAFAAVRLSIYASDSILQT
jgi:hypothetical protein